MFLTQISFGEGVDAYSPFLFLDTGSNLTWIQCEGCNPCFPLQGKHYSYRRSTTFTRVSVDDYLCDPPWRSKDGSCLFDITYDFQPPYPHVRGLLGRENFYFQNSVTKTMDVYQGLAFGCGLSSENMDFAETYGPENFIAGIYGINAGSISFLSQLDSHTNGIFSYCLPPLVTVSVVESTIYFGDDAIITGDATSQVQTVSLHIRTHYYVHLIGISVNGKRLPIDTSIFQLDEWDSSKGLMIDTGAPYTVLAKSAYNPLKEAISRFFQNEYDWSPISPINDFDLCYSPDPNYDDNIYPTIMFHFLNNEQGGEVDMIFDKQHFFIHISDEEGVNEAFCLMVETTKDPGPNVLGSFQQVNFNFLYDVHNKRLSFIPANC
ncbi:hypothetical protein RND81_11G185600 [Saponaria officinalis]|uniref:Peptidase A1 domain-containing protein n=1 Tax=Saponaria officinalis TaxID=3572 RepID=A0AAW1HQG8_SAPOF